jgi:predicted Zn-dependent protease
VIAAMDASNAAIELAQAGGDKEEALARVEEGLVQAPGDSDLLVLKGCLLTLIGGREAEAEAAFEEAEEALGTREYLLLASAQNYVVLGEPAASQADAEAAIALNPRSAQGYLILGQALEDQNDTSGAYAAYEKASALGLEEDNDAAISAQARIKMGMLMQSIQNMMPELETLTPAATP